MSYRHLSDSKINGVERIDLDKYILNAALELGYSYFFSKSDICDLKVKDVFNGNRILSHIKREGKDPIDTSLGLDTFLLQYIEHLKKYYSIDSDSPLFPGYNGEGGKKKFQRHIRRFSVYRDFHTLIYESYRNVYDNILATEPDREKRLSMTSKIVGKSARTIKWSLFDRYGHSSARIEK